MKSVRPPPLAKAVVGAGAAILATVAGLFLVASVVTSLLGLPPGLGARPWAGYAGWPVLASGVALAIWLLNYRKPTDMIVSTYFTFVKMITRRPISELGGRTEPLVIDGPQRYVRHPLYLSVVLLFLGWALVADSTSTIVGVALITAWFVLVQIPFEERELGAIFGKDFELYSSMVPMLVPFSKRHRDLQSSQG